MAIKQRKIYTYSSDKIKTSQSDMFGKVSYLKWEKLVKQILYGRLCTAKNQKLLKTGCDLDATMLGQHCSVLSLVGNVTPDCGLIQAQQYCSILS